MSEGGLRSAAAIAVSVIAVVAVTVIVVGQHAGVIAGLVALPVAIALDWETRWRREAATRSKAD
jgi:hypothetical protein